MFPGKGLSIEWCGQLVVNSKRLKQGGIWIHWYVGHSCFEGWSVSLAFHSLVPHASSLSSEGLAGIPQRISGSSHENNKQTWVQLRTMGTRLGQLMIKDRLREVKIVLLRSRHSDDVHTVSVFPEGDRGPRLGVLRHCAGPTRCKTTFCSCQ